MPSPKVWLVTGSSSGLGLSVVNYALSKGDMVAATLRKPESLSELATRYNVSQLLLIKLDVTKPDEIISAFAAGHKKFGRIDVVYNNAGRSVAGEVEITPDNIARDMFEVNFWGAANISREAIRVFRDVNQPSGGTLLSVSSVSGMVGQQVGGYYSAAKFALEGLTEALAQELDPSWNIRISLLELGGFRTRALDNAVFIPAHPMYQNVTSGLRAHFEDIDAVRNNFGDSNKAAREIYNIANDDQAPLHIPLGLDSIAYIRNKVDTLIKELDMAGERSVDLK